MNKDAILQVLQASNYGVVFEGRNGNNTGVTIKLHNGCIVNLYDTGKISYQGKNTDEIKQAIERVGNTPQNRKVFVVYGHDDVAKLQLESMLRRWDLEPLILDQLESNGNTIIEKLEEYLPQAGFGIVLATPDDIGYPKDKANEIRYRARQNVVMEMGMLFAKLGREKVAILLKNVENMEKPSDIQGIMYMPFTSDVKEVTVDLAKQMNKNGYYLDISKL